MDGHALQHQIPASRLLVKRTRDFLPRPQTRGQGIRHIGQRVSRPAGHHKLALPKQRLGLMPLRDVLEGIDADEQEQPVSLS